LTDSSSFSSSATFFWKLGSGVDFCLLKTEGDILSGCFTSLNIAARSAKDVVVRMGIASGRAFWVNLVDDTSLITA
jgi:hypothetical protein